MRKMFTVGRHSIGIWVDDTTGDAGIVTGYDNDPKIIVTLNISTERTRKNRALFDRINNHLRGIL